MTGADLLSSAVVGAVAGAAASLVNGWLQRKSALEVARVSLVMPMREAWIGKLREKAAWLIASCARIHRKENLTPDLGESVAVTLTEIGLMVNVGEPEQHELLESLKALTAVADLPRDANDAFAAAGKRAVNAARVVLRSEWERTKGGAWTPKQ